MTALIAAWLCGFFLFFVFFSCALFLAEKSGHHMYDVYFPRVLAQCRSDIFFWLAK